MPARWSQLRSAVDALEQELRALPDLDEKTRTQLDETLASLRSGIEEEAADRLQDSEQDPSVVDRLSDAAQEIESSHPALSALIGKIGDALSQLGI